MIVQPMYGWICRQSLFEKLLPYVVWRSSDESVRNEPGELDKV